jgi:hypothetical protein
MASNHMIGLDLNLFLKETIQVAETPDDLFDHIVSWAEVHRDS